VAGALEVRLLGDFRLTAGGRPVSGFASGRLQALLAYLLLHREAAQARAHLAFTFWPDATESGARNSLRQLLHQLRQALPEADRHVHATASTVEWSAGSDLRLDVADFEQALREADAAERRKDGGQRRAALERAVGHCQGPLLPSCYDDWIGPLRDGLVRRCEDATQALVVILEAEREYPAAIGQVRHWLAHDPLDEAAYRWLMKLLALAGDRPAALQAYRELCLVLRRELSAEPSPETVRVHERIRDSDPGAVSSLPARSEPAAAISLVGRQPEWSRLRQAWDQAGTGRASVALVTGEPGIGKSRLAEELLAWARQQGLAAARTRSYAAEGRLSLAPVAEWLRGDAILPYLGRIEAVWRTEVARILPELLASSPELPPPAPMTEFGDRLRFFEGLARAILAAPPPLLLVIDDLQWCDRETLEFLHFLLRFDPAARLLVTGTARSEEVEADHPLPPLLRQLRGDARLVEIPLAPLDAAETATLAALVGTRPVDSEAATRLYHATEGNPLFVVETVREESGDAAAPGPGEERILGLPPRAHAVIAGRIAGLSDNGRETAAVAAVIGRAFSSKSWSA
jgi:DNA-binding SARP family transcriptional activator